MKLYQKIFTIITSLTLFFNPVLVFAAAPVPSVDESAYITLDYYGQTKQVNIVKSVDLNGNNQFIDYGQYQNVKNMTTLAEPQISSDKIIWQFNSTVPKKFYYQITPKDNYLAIPWDIDVSYKLNGVPAKPQSLAGASGLVAIDINVTPNSKVAKYYQDNFILTAGMLVDSDNNYSFSAPGSQLQSFGSDQIAFFIALPKQTKTFHFEIGSDKFETDGLFFAMVPATLDQLKDVKEIKEHKNNLENAGNAIDSLTDDILSIANGMKTGLGTTHEGLDKLNDARQSVEDNYNDNVDSLNNTKDSLNSLASQLKSYNAIIDSGALGATTSATTKSLGIYSGISQSSDLLGNLSSNITSVTNTTSDTHDSLNEGMSKSLSGLSQLTSSLNSVLDKTDDIKKNKDTISSIIKDEWHRFDKDLGILDINVNSSKQSFTSTKNQPARSLQIILRTEEINLDDNKTVTVESSPVDNLGFWGRLGYVFTTIYQAIKTAF